MKDVEITYKLERNEFLIHRLKNYFLNYKVAIYFLFLLTLVLFPYTISLANPDYVAPETDTIESLKPLFFLVFFPLLFVAVIWYSYHKTYNANKELHGSVTVKLTELEYFGTTSNTEARRSWGTIYQVRKKGNMLDIYFQKRLYSSIPLRYITLQQLENIKIILDTNDVKNNL